MHFSEAFWNETTGDFSGWENLVGVLKGGRQNLKYFVETLRQRAELEESYGKSLLKLSRGISFEKDVSPLHTAWTSFRLQTEVSAEAHLKTARELAEEAGVLVEVCEKLRGNRKFREETVRQCQQKLKQDFRRAIEGKKLYESRCSEEIMSSQTFHKEVARYGKSSREAERAKAKFDRARQCLKGSEVAYKLLVRDAEESRARWERETTDSLKEFQSMEEDRIQSARNSLWKVANIISVHCVKDDTAQEELRLDLERCSVANCLQELANDNCTGETKPSALGYESFPTSSYYGLGPAALNAGPRNDNTLTKIPPKPPRLIHYVPTSSWQNKINCSESTRFPIVDSVDNIEYFNLSDPASVSSSDSTSNDFQSLSDFQMPFDLEKKIW